MRARMDKFIDEKFTSIWDDGVFVPIQTLVHGDFGKRPVEIPLTD